MENTKKILCLEDSAMVRDIMRIPLKLKGIKVDFIINDEKGKSIIEKISDEDLKKYYGILLNAQVPNFDDLAKKIIERAYPVEKIYIYGTSDPQLHGGIDLPVMYLPKMNINLTYYLGEYFAATN